MEEDLQRWKKEAGKEANVKTRQFVVDKLGRNQPGRHREAKARHGSAGILLELQRHS